MADEYFRIFETAWESFSGWMSEKISSLSSMASNAANTIMNFGGGGGVGHNATGTASWCGGFTEVNEQGGEISLSQRNSKCIDL